MWTTEELLTSVAEVSPINQSISQSINQTNKTLIQVDKPQRDNKIITLAKNEIKIR